MLNGWNKLTSRVEITQTKRESPPNPWVKFWMFDIKYLKKSELNIKHYLMTIIAFHCPLQQSDYSNLVACYGGPSPLAVDCYNDQPNHYRYPTVATLGPLRKSLTNSMGNFQIFPFHHTKFTFQLQDLSYCNKNCNQSSIRPISILKNFYRSLNSLSIISHL